MLEECLSLNYGWEPDPFSGSLELAGASHENGIIEVERQAMFAKRIPHYPTELTAKGHNGVCDIRDQIPERSTLSTTALIRSSPVGLGRREAYVILDFVAELV
jgi:hypothetical protein